MSTFNLLVHENLRSSSWTSELTSKKLRPEIFCLIDANSRHWQTQRDDEPDSENLWTPNVLLFITRGSMESSIRCFSDISIWFSGHISGYKTPVLSDFTQNPKSQLLDELVWLWADSPDRWRRVRGVRTPTAALTSFSWHQRGQLHLHSNMASTIQLEPQSCQHSASRYIHIIVLLQIHVTFSFRSNVLECAGLFWGKAVRPRRQRPAALTPSACLCAVHCICL